LQRSHDHDDLIALLRCQACGSTLQPASPSADNVDRLACTRCDQRAPIRFGIPDLRGWGVSDPYISFDDDLRAAERLHERAQTGSFEEALASYYETNERVTPDQARRFIAGVLAAEDRSRAVLGEWRDLADGPVADANRRTTLLDVGCGTGPLLVAASELDAGVIGVDIGLRWLVLARARLRDRGVSATLLCASADRLPLAASSIDLAASESLYENVPSAQAALTEAGRVLRAGGWLCLTTPNRWSLGPDPHVGLPLGGWLPDSVVAAWASRRGMLPPRRRLLGARETRATLSRLPFSEVRLRPPPIAESQLRGASGTVRAAVSAYRTVAGSAVGRALLLAIGPSLLAVARRNGNASGIAAR
jgi:SAM-dependent methyltransferase